MSDSEELLFGNITDADDGSDDNKNNDGTSYPQHLQTIAMDSSDSDSLHRIHSTSGSNKVNKPSAIQIKRKKSKTKLERDKSRKRMEEHAMNGASLNDSPVGETQLQKYDTNTGSKPTKFKQMKSFLNGKSKRKDHHMISVEDSEDEYDDDEDDHIYDNTERPSNHMYCDALKHIINTFMNNGHIISIILTLIVFITMLISMITSNIVAIILFVVCYVLYLLECFMNKTWKEMNMNKRESAEGTTKLLDTLRNTAPVIDWHIECYHFETKHINKKQNKQKTIVWVQGTPENGDFFEELGFDMKYFKFDWNGINYVEEKENQEYIAAIVVPSGFEGKRIQKGMLEKLEKIYHDDVDFFEWNEDINELIEEFKNRNVIQEDKEKIVTYTSSMNYDYNEWNDISVNYPNFNKHQITKLNISKTYCLENEETRNDFEEQKQAFVSLNTKDEFQSITENLYILGFKDCITIKNDTQNTPFWYTVHGYWICSVLLFTLYPRYKYYTIFAVKKWKIIKSISI